jgi:hypothetical protein
MLVNGAPDGQAASAGERIARRAMAGCGVVLALIVATIAITFGGVLLHAWLDPDHGQGLGQGEGIIAGMVILVTPLFGLIAAWKVRVGIALGALLMLALLLLHILAILGL